MGKIEFIESIKEQYEKSGYIDISLPIDKEEFQAIIDAFDFYIAEYERAQEGK